MTERYGIRVTGARNYTEAQWERDTIPALGSRSISPRAPTDVFARFDMRFSVAVYSRASEAKDYNISGTERGFLGSRKQIVPRGLRTGCIKQNWRLSKTDSLLTTWKYGMDEIAHVGITNLQVQYYARVHMCEKH